MIGAVYVGIKVIVKFYKLTYEQMIYFEDAQDLMFFEYVKAIQNQTQEHETDNPELFWINYRK